VLASGGVPELELRVMVGPDAAATVGANARTPATPERASSASARIELAFEVFVIPIGFIRLETAVDRAEMDDCSDDRVCAFVDSELLREVTADCSELT